MKTYLNSNNVTFEIDYYEAYDKEQADKLAKKTIESESDFVYVKGRLQVHEVKLLQSEYKKEAIALTRHQLRQLQSKIEEIESTEVQCSLNEYYS